MNKKDKTYSIGQVANIAGIPKYKLRHWCNRYLTHIEKIEIGSSRHRRFTETDIELIHRIKKYRAEGYVLATAVRKAAKDTGSTALRNLVRA